MNIKFKSLMVVILGLMINGQSVAAVTKTAIRERLTPILSTPALTKRPSSRPPPSGPIAIFFSIDSLPLEYKDYVDPTNPGELIVINNDEGSMIPISLTLTLKDRRVVTLETLETPSENGLVVVQDTSAIATAVVFDVVALTNGSPANDVAVSCGKP